MRQRTLIVIFLLVFAAAGGCQQYSNRDVSLLGQYGGRFVLSGEGPGWRMTPVGTVAFDDHDRSLTDEDFAAVFPAVSQMDPMVLLLRGHHSISDASVPLLNQLRAVEQLDLSGTEISHPGLKGLRLNRLKGLVVAPSRMNDKQVADLRRAFPSVRVTRWQGPNQQEATVAK